jgi:hypothetical protein
VRVNCDVHRCIHRWKLSSAMLFEALRCWYSVGSPYTDERKHSLQGSRCEARSDRAGPETTVRSRKQGYARF